MCTVVNFGLDIKMMHHHILNGMYILYQVRNHIELRPRYKNNATLRPIKVKNFQLLTKYKIKNDCCS